VYVFLGVDCDVDLGYCRSLHGDAGRRWGFAELTA
jgi:hypothetical protein